MYVCTLYVHVHIEPHFWEEITQEKYVQVSHTRWSFSPVFLGIWVELNSFGIGTTDRLVRFGIEQSSFIKIRPNKHIAVLLFHRPSTKKGTIMMPRRLGTQLGVPNMVEITTSFWERLVLHHWILTLSRSLVGGAKEKGQAKEEAEGEAN